MDLSHDLIAQFVKATKDTDKAKNGSTNYGTVVKNDDGTFVQLDGSDLLTPAATTVNVSDGNRVTVLIKDHNATITGNLSSPSASSGEVEEIGDKISEFDNIIADTVTTDQLYAEQARIDELTAEVIKVSELEAENVLIRGELEANSAKIHTLTSDNVIINDTLKAANAEIDNLRVDIADIETLHTDELEATNAQIYNLEATYGNFQQLTAGRLDVAEADIEDLKATTANITNLDAKYANIDFANIGEAAIETFFSKSGMIEDLTVSDGVFTGTLVGVTIKGDLIEGGTVVADKLVVQGEDGLYYKLNVSGEKVESEQTERNSINGNVILAKSIVATKIDVDDLAAFKATIGGFKIGDHSIYSGVKESSKNTTQGIYMDDDGQLVVGDANNFFKYYYYVDEETGEKEYILDISSVSDAEERLNESIQTEKTEIISTAQNMILSALETYVQTGDYGEFKQTVETQLEILAGEIEMNFTTTTEQVTNVDGDIQAKFAELYKYIRFSGETAITIGSGDNSIVLEIDNEKGIVFRKNGTALGLWNGVDFYTGNVVVEVDERAQFGNFAFVPRSDGSLSFLRVGSPPLIVIEQPKDVIVFAGESWELRYEVKGHDVAYQWQYLDYASSSDGMRVNLEGATSSVLTRTEAYADHAGTYLCVATNRHGDSVESSPVEVTVENTIQITTEPQDTVYILDGDPAVLNVIAEGEDLTYQWQSQNESDGSWSDITNLTKATIQVIFDKYFVNRTLYYRCVVADKYGFTTTTRAAAVTVQEST